MIVTNPNLNLRYIQELIQYLEEDIRLDMGEFAKMDIKVFEACTNVSKKQVTINNLIKLLKK